MNNLYGWVIVQPLPVGEFQWIETRKVFPERKDFGYMSKVSVDYTKELHDPHNNFPLMKKELCKTVQTIQS